MNRMKKLLKEIADTYELFVLQVTHESIVPGTVMNCEWHRVIESRKWPEFTRTEGIAWQLEPSLAGGSNGHARKKAGLYEVKHFRKMRLGADASIEDLGLNVSANVDFERTVTITVGDVEVVHFEEQGRAIALAEGLRRSSLYDPWLEKDFLVSEAYYATSLIVDIKAVGTVSPKAAWTAAGVKPIETSATLDWKTDSSFTLKSPFTAPFAVRGYKL